MSSWLKAAYDTLGSEINKTFDSSSKENLGAKEEENVADGKGEEPSIYSTPKGGAEHLKVNTAQRVREGSKEHDTDGWSSWDDRESGTGKSRSKSPKLATPSGSNSSLCSPSPGSSSGVLEEAKGKGSEGSSPRGGGKGEAMTGKSSSGGGTPLASSTPSKPASQGPSGKSQLESLSREDMVKYIRKQGLALQKTKAKCEELNKELEASKRARTTVAEDGGSRGDGGEGVRAVGGGQDLLMEEVQVAKSERDKAVAESRTLRQTVSSLGRTKEDLTDRYQALEDAHSKLKTLFREQQDSSALKDQEQASVEQQQTSGESTAEEELESLRSVNSSLSSEVETLQSKLEEQWEGSGIKEKQLAKDKAALESKYVELAKKAKKLQNELKAAREKLVSRDEDWKAPLVEKNEALAKKVRSFTSQLVLIQEAKEEAVKERNRAQANAQELEEKLEESVAKESALMEEVRSARSTCADLKQSIGAAQVREEKLNGDLTELRGKLAESEQLLSENKGEEALAELARASNREETLRGDMAALQGKYDELEQCLANKAGVEESMQEDRDELKSRLLQLEKALEEEKKQTKLLNDTNERLEQSALHSQQKVGDLEEESRNLLTKVQRLEETGSKVKSDLISAQGQLEQTVANLDAAHVELSRSRSVVAKMETEASERSSELEQVRDELEEQKEKVVELEMSKKSDGDRFASELDIASSHSRELEQQLCSEREQTKTKLVELEESLQVGDRELTSAKEEIKALQSVLELKSLESDSHMQQVTALRSSVSDLQDKLRSKDSEVEAFQRDQVDGQNVERSELQAQVASLQEQNLSLVKECELLKGTAQQHLVEKEGLHKQRDEAKSEVKAVKETMGRELHVARSSLEKEISSHKEENKKLKVFAVKVKKELSETKEQSTSLLQELQSVQAKWSHEVEELKKKLASVSEEKEVLVESLQGQLLSLQVKCDEESSNAHKAFEDAEKCRLEMENCREASGAEISGLKAELAALGSSKEEEFEQALLEKERRLQVVDEEIVSLRAAAQSKSLESMTSLEEIKTLQSRIAQLQEQVKGAAELGKSDGEDVRRQLGLLEEQNLQLKEELKTNEELYQSKLEELRQDKGAVSTELQKAKEELQALEKTKEVMVEQARGVQEKEVAAQREENKKLKAFAMKLKKELVDSRDRESSLTQELQAARASSSQEAEDLKKRLSGVEEEKGVLVESLRSQLVALQSKYEEDARLLDKAAEEAKKYQAELEEVRELSQSELSSLQAELAAARSESNTSKMGTEAVKQELHQLREELEKEAEGHRDTREKLSLVEKEANASSLMSMELEDYQRSIQALEGGMAAKEQLLEKAKQDSQVHLQSLQHLKKDMELLSQQRSQSEETVTKLKQLLVKTKKELAEGQRREEGLRSARTDLHTQLEEERQGSEQAKVEVAQFTAKIQSMKQQTELSVDNLQRVSRGLEQRLTLTQSELMAVKASLATTQSEYDSYKVRVHSVLKQKSSGAGQAEVNAEMRQKYEKELAKLNSDVQDLRNKLSSSLAEHEELLVEYEQLASRHEQLLQEAERKRESLEHALREEASRHALQMHQQDDMILRLRQETEEATVGFKTQLHSLQLEHNKVVVGVKEELKVAQTDLARLQQEADSRVLANAQSSSAPSAPAAPPAGSSGQESVSGGPVGGPRGVTEAIRPPFEQRSSGEGMEQAQLESVTGGIPSTPDSTIDFERLLSLGDSELSSLTTSKYEPKSEAAIGEHHVKYQKQLKLAAKKVQHLTELLRESEASALRLVDQAKLLKEEIRRLERNKERERSVSNMEYLKNVILKFLHNEGEEKKALVPVIEKLLLLSPHEAKFLEDSVIRGKTTDLPIEVGTSDKAAKAPNWSSYVHRWTGY